MFNDFVKSTVEDTLRGDREKDNPKLADKLNEIVAEMINAAPSLPPSHARRWLLHTPQGLALLAQHKIDISKGDIAMSQVNVMKLHNIDSESSLPSSPAPRANSLSTSSRKS
jgi:hypothetical protein